MDETQRNLIKKEIQTFFLGDRGSRSSRLFVTEINKPDDERNIPASKKEFFAVVDEVINELYLGPKPKVSG